MLRRWNKHSNYISVPAWNTPPTQLVPFTTEMCVYDIVGHLKASVAYLTDYHSLEWDSPTQDALLLKREKGSINYSSWFESYAGGDAVNLNLFMGFASDPRRVEPSRYGSMSPLVYVWTLPKIDWLLSFTNIISRTASDVQRYFMSKSAVMLASQSRKVFNERSRSHQKFTCSSLAERVSTSAEGMRVLMISLLKIILVFKLMDHVHCCLPQYNILIHCY